MINSSIKINLILLIIFVCILKVLSKKTLAFDCTSVQKYSQIWNYNNCGGDPNKNKNRPVFQIDGWGGQTITIDFEKNRIIAILAIHRDYNWIKLVHSKF